MRSVSDGRIQRIIEAIRESPACPLSADDCARRVHLSRSRFLHLFPQEVGTSFRVFRMWKRARGMLHCVNQPINTTRVALNAGYNDATHFSHSIRQVFGLRPRDLFAGSRRQAIHARGRQAA